MGSNKRVDILDILIDHKLEGGSSLSKDALSVLASAGISKVELSRLLACTDKVCEWQIAELLVLRDLRGRFL